MIQLTDVFRLLFRCNGTSISDNNKQLILHIIRDPIQRWTLYNKFNIYRWKLLGIPFSYITVNSFFPNEYFCYFAKSIKNEKIKEQS